MITRFKRAAFVNALLSLFVFCYTANAGTSDPPTPSNSAELTWQSVTRGLNYDLTVYPPNLGQTHGTISYSETWTPNNESNDVSSPIPWPTLSGKLSGKYTFPAEWTQKATDGLTTASGHASHSAAPPCYYYRATLDHYRYWLSATTPYTEDFVEKIIIYKSGKINSEDQPSEVEMKNVTITSGSLHSGLVDLTPSFQTDSPTGADPYTEDRSIDLVPIEIKVADRDDETKTWDDAKYHSLNTPVFAGEHAGDMVSWKIAGPSSWSSYNFKWTAEKDGEATITGPENTGAEEWKFSDDESTDPNHDRWLSDSRWKPGKWKIKCLIRKGDGTTIANVEFEQEIGIRTNQYIAVGSIRPQAESTQGVSQQVINLWSCPHTVIMAASAVGGGVNNSGKDYFVPFDEPNRVYVMQRLLNSTADSDPTSAIDAEQSINLACGLDPVKHYRGFAAGQFRYRVDENKKLKEKPVPIKDNCNVLIGNTPVPCTGGTSGGAPGILNSESGKTKGETGETEFSYLLKFRVDSFGQKGFANLEGRNIPWVFFKFRFLLDDGLIDTRFEAGASDDPDGPDANKDLSHVPTFYIYTRYFDVEEKKWKLEIKKTINQQNRPFMSIGTTISGAPYIVP